MLTPKEALIQFLIIAFFTLLGGLALAHKIESNQTELPQEQHQFIIFCSDSEGDSYPVEYVSDKQITYQEEVAICDNLAAQGVTINRNLGE